MSDRESKISAIVRQIGLSYLLQVLAVVSNLWVSRAVVEQSGVQAFGFLALVGPLGAFVGLLDGGISSACAREMIAALGGGNRERYAELLHVLRRWLQLLAVLIGVAFVIVALTIERWVDLQDMPADQVRLAVLLVGANQLVAILLRTPTIILTTHQRNDLLSLFAVLTHIPSALLSIVLVNLGYGVLGVVGTQLMFGLLGSIYAWWLAQSRFPTVAPSKRRPEWATMRPVFAFSGWLFAEQVAMVAYFQTALVLSSSMLGLGAAAVLAVTMRPANMVQSGLFSLTTPLFQYSAELGGGKRVAESARLHLLGCRISSALGLPAGLALACYTAPFVTLWLKPELVGSALLIGAVAMQVTLQVFWHTTGSMIAGHGRDIAIRHAQVVIIGAGLTLVLSFASMPWLGNEGAILAIIIGAVATSGWWLPRAASEAFGHSVAEYWKESLWRPLPSVIPFLVIAVPLRYLLPVDTWPWLIAQLGMGAICVLAGGLLLGVSQNTRQSLVRRVRQAFGQMPDTSSKTAIRST